MRRQWSHPEDCHSPIGWLVVQLTIQTMLSYQSANAILMLHNKLLPTQCHKNGKYYSHVHNSM